MAGGAAAISAGKKGLSLVGALGGSAAKAASPRVQALGGAAWGAGAAAGQWAVGQVSEAVMPGFWIMLCVLIYLSDRFVTGFGGTSFSVLISRFSALGSENFTRIAFFVVFTGFLVYLMTRGKGGNLKSSVALSAVLSAIIFLGEFNTGLFHLIFALVLYLGLAKPIAEKEGAKLSNLNYLFAVLLAFDFFGQGIITEVLKHFGFISLPFNLANRFLLPVWFIYTLSLTSKFKKSLITKVLTLAIIVVMVFSWIGDVQVVTGMSYKGLATQTQTAEEFGEAVSAYNRSITSLKDFAGILADPIICSQFIADSEKYQSCIKSRQIVRHPELNESAIKGEIEEKMKEITNVAFVKSERFPSAIQSQFTPTLPVDYLLNISSPKTIKIKLYCSFKSAKAQFDGIVGPEETVNKLADEGINGTKRELVFCTPPMKYEPGSYTVTFTADIFDLQTKSWLTRLFVGPDVSKERVSQLKALHELEDSASSSGSEFAAFSFNFGLPSSPGVPVSSVIDDSQIQILEGGIENLGSGKLTKVSSIEITLIDGIRPSAECISQNSLFSYAGNKLLLKPDKIISNLEIQKGKTVELLKGCYFTVSDVLRYPKLSGVEYFKKEFSSTMSYSYRITKEDRFQVISEPSLAGLT